MYTQRFSRTAVRAFSTTPASRKSAVDSVKDAADKLNKSVGRGLASAIDKTENAAQKTKETVSGASHDAKVKTDKAADATKKSAKQTKDDYNNGLQDNLPP